MLTSMCLIWLGIRLLAPTWYFICCGTVFLINAISIGIKLSEAGSK